MRVARQPSILHGPDGAAEPFRRCSGCREPSRGLCEMGKGGFSGCREKVKKGKSCVTLRLGRATLKHSGLIWPAENTTE